MKTYLFLFAFALLTTLALTPLVRRLALRWGAVDMPDSERRIHLHPTPRLGGLAVFAAFLLALGALPLLNTLVSEALLRNLDRLDTLLLAGTLIFLLGVVDDFRGLNARAKIAVQVLAAALLYWDGFRIQSLSLPFAAHLDFSIWLGFPLTVLWIVGLTNAFNLIDGIDGLAAGASVFAMLSLFVTSLINGHTEICVLSVILAGAVMGFLRYNFNPASIFLGDSGSLFLGFMCAALSLVSAQKGSTLIAVAIPLVSFGLPVVEVGLSLTRRLVSGAPVFQSDRRHIHHMLLLRGLSQRQTVILLYGVCALFSLFGIMLLNPQRNNFAMIFAILGACVILGVQHLRYDEFGVLTQQLRRGVRIRRRALAADLQIRLATAGLQQAASYEELSVTLNQLFMTSEFDCVLLEVYGQQQRQLFGPPEPASLNPGLVTLPTRQAPHRVEWSWNWQGESLDLNEVRSSPHFWALRIPLAGQQGQALGAITFYRHVTADDLAVDLTRIRGALRDELSAALERLETPVEAAPELEPLHTGQAQLSFLRS